MEQNKINICNYWGELYPTDLSELIAKCELAILNILKIFANKNCIVLDDLYKEKNQNGVIHRQRAVFEANGYMPNSKLSRKFKTDNELKGLYVFAEIASNGQVLPCYVGISGTIFRRLKQHGWHKLHNEATLAYLKASNKYSYSGKRENLEYDKIFEQQQLIRQYKVAIIPELLDYDLYFMEVYIAGKLQTKWNSFKTH